jgi:hypothetical protein
MVTCSSLCTFSSLSKFSLFSATFCYADMVHALSMEPQSLRRSCSAPSLSHSHWNTCCTWRRAECAASSASRSRIGSSAWRQGRPMTTSSTLSSFSEVVAAPACGKEEDVPTAGLVMAVAPPAAIAFTVEAVSRAGAPTSCAPPIAEPYGPPSSEVPWAPDPWREGVMFAFDTLESRSRGQ